VEVTTPRRDLQQAGANVQVVTPGGRPVRGYHYIEPQDTIPADLALAEARPGAFDCLVLPGGLGGPDTLRADATAVELVRRFVVSGRPVGVICHGPWVLAEAGGVATRALTCASAIASDVKNAGGRYVDADVHVDSDARPLLVSGRNHTAVEPFARTLVQELDRSA
jgi:protease I